ncbi:hypothetical protein C8J57DRAFT_1320506 [Mycena rebaudengoi]|nr:hypothetical protein C8J57DRAFT_1320506 [Mycena rebaudengoi]
MAPPTPVPGLLSAPRITILVASLLVALVHVIARAKPQHFDDRLSGLRGELTLPSCTSCFRSKEPGSVRGAGQI